MNQEKEGKLNQAEKTRTAVNLSDNATFVFGYSAFFFLRYFRLEGCMGLAVYVNVESNRAEHRGAQMIALGILVKPSAETGRCGQVWRHIQFLKSQVR